MAETGVEALLFDVFGTVVDWRGSVIREGEAISRRTGIEIDWGPFADTWRKEGYLAPIARVARGEDPWTKVDTLHRRMLDRLLVDYGIRGLTETEIDHFNRVWHRLDPWPDAVGGLTRLRSRFLIAPFSNGDFALLTRMAKRAGLPWDCILSCELFASFKPNPGVYREAVALLDLPVDAVMMIAAHTGDLEAAGSVGLRTAYVERPLEFGPGGPRDTPPNSAFNLVATDFHDLANKLGA